MSASSGGPAGWRGDDVTDDEIAAAMSIPLAGRGTGSVHPSDGANRPLEGADGGLGADGGGRSAWPQPEDRGAATLSKLGETEYVEDLVKPGRIVLIAGEEGSGKSYAVEELAIRIAIAGGSLYGTWPVLKTGPVLVLSEMHPDDDYSRETTILASLGLSRPALAARYFRLDLMTAARDIPALMSDEWLGWVAAWLRDHQALLLVVDTATGATQVDPWGRDIQAVYRRLRALVADYPSLAIVLLVHLRKPSGRGDRRISDVLGEWGRWCDVVILLERDGPRTGITTRKRVRRERRIAATKAGGLLVDAVDLDGEKPTKVPLESVLMTVKAEPGIGIRDLAARLGVSKDTASNYVKALAGAVVAAPSGPRRGLRLYPIAEPPNAAEPSEIGGRSVEEAAEVGDDRRTPNDSMEFGGRSSAVIRTSN